MSEAAVQDMSLSAAAAVIERPARMAPMKQFFLGESYWACLGMTQLKIYELK
jgi:hypothetical protein